MIKIETKKRQALILIFCFLSSACTSSNLVYEPEASSTPVNIPNPEPSSNPASPPVKITVNSSLNPVTTISPVPVKTSVPIIPVIPNPIPINTAVPLPSVKQNTVLFDTGKNSFGNIGSKNINSLSNLKEFLLSSKFEPIFDNFSARKTLDDIGTIIIPSPSLDYSQAELDKLSAFVKSGKKVIILGEWGGYAGFSATSINKFLEEANLKINEDVIKETEVQNFSVDNEQLIITNFAVHPLTTNLKSIAVYSSASVSTITGKIIPFDSNKTKIIARSSNSSFKIQEFSSGTSGIIAISNIGSGKVIVIGDTSLFTNSDSNNDGKINLEEENNKQLILNIINW